MVKWGILGLGKIANRFADEILEVNNAKLVAIASLTKNKLNDFGNKYNIENEFRFNNYDNLLNSNAIDAVYISTLNNTHADLIIKAANVNKNILCEKPFALNKKESNQVFKKLNESKVFFLENFAYRSHPQTKVLSELILNNEIGEIYEAETSFGYNVKKVDPISRIFNKKLGGGAILDVGCYPVSFALFLSNLLNENIDFSNFKMKDVSGKICSTGVDELAYGTLSIDNRINIKMNTSIRKEMDNFSTIFGSKGKIKIPEIWSPGKKNILEISIGNSYYKKIITSKLSLFGNQIKQASMQIENSKKEGIYPQMSWKESILNMILIDNWINLINNNVN